MCFIIHKDHSEPKKAEKDITCYKRLHRNYVAPYQNFQYRKDLEYKSTIISYGASINEGLHSYSNSYKALYITTPFEFAPYTYCLKLLLKIFKKIYTGGDIVVICKIPKGSTYYYNPIENEYVSDRLKVIG